MKQVCLMWYVFRPAFKKLGEDKIGQTPVYIAVTAETLRKLGINAIVFEQQKSYEYKNSGLNKFQRNKPD